MSFSSANGARTLSVLCRKLTLATPDSRDPCCRPASTASGSTRAQAILAHFFITHADFEVDINDKILCK